LANIFKPVTSGHFHAGANNDLWLAGILGSIVNKSHVSYLIKRLEEGHYHRCQIARALGSIGDARALDILIKALKDRFYWFRKIERSFSAFAGRQNNIEIKAFIQELKDPCSEANQILHQFCGEKEGKEVAEGLMRDLSYSSTHPTVSEEAATAIARIGGDRAIDALTEAITESDSSIGIEFLIETLATSKSKRAITPLRKLLEHPTASVRKSVIEALGNIGGTEATDAILHAMTDANIDVFLCAIYWLGHIQGADDSAVKRLIGYIPEPGLEERPELALDLIEESRMARLDFPKGSDGVLIIELIRESIIKALGRSGNELSVKPLLRLLDNLYGSSGICVL
jgi:HEAT repeat protein